MLLKNKYAFFCFFYVCRPEHIESAMVLYRATGDPFLLEVGEDALRSLQYSARTECGYATIKNVKDHRKEDRMESFFLAETLKYLYLLFDPDNFLHNDGREGTIINTPHGECIIESGGYIFNTEAHPMDPGAIRCCHEVSHEYPLEGFDPKVVIGEKFVERPRNKKVEKPKPIKPPPVVDHLEITIEELQQFLENAKKLSELEQKAVNNNTQNVSNDDSIILAVEAQRNEKDSVQAPNVQNKNGEDALPEVLKKRLEKMKEQLKKVSELSAETKEQEKFLYTNTNEKTENSVKVDESDVEIVKLPKSSARDADDQSTTQGKVSNDSPEINTQATQGTTANEFNNKNSDNYTIIYKENLSNGGVVMDEKTMMNNLMNDSITNNSVFQEFVQTIIKVTGRSNSFDPQTFLEHIRTNGVYRNESWSKEYRLLRCKAQPFLQRLSVLGQFFY